MSETGNNSEHTETVELVTEALEECLNNAEANTELIEQFNNMERTVFMAGQQGIMGINEGLGSLAGYASRGHQVCASAGYGDGETFFMSKSETYRNMMEAMASKPATEPKPTDTDKRKMSEPKDRI